MKKTLILVSLICTIIILTWSSCKHDPDLDTINPPPGSEHPCDPDTVYFEMDLLPILASNCAVSGCHDATATEDVRLDSYTAVMNSDIIKPGDPTDSDLYDVLVETDLEKRMPYQLDPLQQADIDLVYKWIQQGAQNLFCDEMCDSVNVTYSQTIWSGIIQKTCYGCHNGASASGGIHLENYNDISAAAQIPAGQPGSLYGAVSHHPNNSHMPKNGNKLSDCKLAQIRKWINDGTPNN